MKSLITIQEFYDSRYNWVPEEVRKNLAHFNVFPLSDDVIGEGAQPLEYRRREWYNITLVQGSGIHQCAEKEYEVKQNAIVFNNPHEAFGWKTRDQLKRGYFCMFNKEFLGGEKRILEYPLFQAGGRPLFELTEKQALAIEKYFHRLIQEIDSNYIHKYDIAKIIVAEIMHFTMKLEQFETSILNKKSASEKLAVQFLELLERQFPIENENDTIKIRRAADFAKQLNVHVNHLNRAIKKVTQKTTTQLIHERILLEAKILLKHTAWNISEIAYRLNFKEASHFNSFFKKYAECTPLQFRSL